jgi:hypothetical protein
MVISCGQTEHSTTSPLLYEVPRSSSLRWNTKIACSIGTYAVFLGRKGEVNSGLTHTLTDEPQHFYYYNNGISALCEDYEFDEDNRKLSIRKLQIVNGAQTIGALKHASGEQLICPNLAVGELRCFPALLMNRPSITISSPTPIPCDFRNSSVTRHSRGIELIEYVCGIVGIKMIARSSFFETNRRSCWN